MIRIILGLFISAALLSSCSNKMGSTLTYKVDEQHTAGMSKAWRGTYSGTMMTDDCNALDIRVSLQNDMNYIMTGKCAGSSGPGLRSTGKYLIDASGTVVTLTTGNGKDVGRFVIDKGNLAQVDKNGNRIGGDIASQYVLRR